MSPFHEKALSEFVTTSDVKASDLYVTVPVSWTVNVWSPPDNRYFLNNPSEALSGGDSTFDSPFLCLVVGPAGAGKSELLRQLCLRGMLNPQVRQVFPIRLSACRMASSPSLGRSTKPITEAQLREFLFFSLAEDKGVGADIFAKGSFEAISGRQMILALDGLDEIIASLEQHERFWQALWQLLQAAMPVRDIRLLVTCRTDYLRALGLDHKDDFAPADSAGARLPAHFFTLNFFSPSLVRAYLRNREISDPVLLEKAGRLQTDLSGIGEIMQRPLLLKLLCDLTGNPGSGPLPGDSTELLNRLTVQAEARLKARSEADKVPLYSWDRDKLAVSSLDLFKRSLRKEFRNPEFSIGEVDAFLNKAENEGLTDSDRWAAIHHCPFLRRAGKDRVQFTHDVFFEYFVARGMYLPVARGAEDWIDFDRYVLQPDMRRFLRGLIGEGQWRERTRRSYSMQEPDGLDAWPDPAWARANFDDLERVRFKLLDFITRPDAASDPQQPVAVAGLIEEFFRFDREKTFPAYRMYNLEAACVFVWTYKWRQEAAGVLKLLEPYLLRVLQEAAAESVRNSDCEICADSLERLVLRVMDIGYRLKLPAVMKQSRRETSISWMRNEETQAEAKFVISRIEKQLRQPDRR